MSGSGTNSYNALSLNLNIFHLNIEIIGRKKDEEKKDEIENISQDLTELSIENGINKRLDKKSIDINSLFNLNKR